jgi:hypothetical protein
MGVVEGSRTCHVRTEDFLIECDLLLRPAEEVQNLSQQGMSLGRAWSYLYPALASPYAFFILSNLHRQITQQTIRPGPWIIEILTSLIK